MIVGGMGGIGQSIARWMARSLDCKNLIVLSRTARTHPDRAALVADVEAAGCRVSVQSCDVSSEADFRRVLDQVRRDESFPPIRGVVQAAMTLNVSFPTPWPNCDLCV